MIMAKFLHLLLLLATVQLPLVSATCRCLQNTIEVVFRYPDSGTCSKPDNVGNNVKNNEKTRELTFTNVTPCNNPNKNLKVLLKKNLKNSNGKQCNESDLENISLSTDQSQHFYDIQTAARCKRLCTKHDSCRFYTHIPRQGCFLNTNEKMVVEINDRATSGFPERCNGNNEDTPKDLQFISERKEWTAALKHCRDQETSLVEITGDVGDQVKTLLTNKNSAIGEGVWIGLERGIFGTEAPWMWVSGSEVTRNDTHWNGSFPVDNLNFHCGKIIKVKGEWKWVDAWCHDKLPFICQDPEDPSSLGSES